MTKILCVEDEVDIRQILAEELSDVGYEVFEAGNGREGLDAIVANSPDLVLCDITMPVMDGHSLLTELRDNHPEQADTPFIFLSALADREHVLQGKSLGADDYLTKPVDIDMLLATIDSRLRQIARMTKRKEEQFVKLYKSFNSPCSPKAATARDDDPTIGMEQGRVEIQEARPESVDSSPADQRIGSNRHEAEPVHPDDGENSIAGEPKDPTLAERVLNLLQNGNSELLVARATLSGLDEVKATLGNQWAGQASTILGTATEQLEEFASEQNVVEVQPDESILVIFGPTADASKVSDWVPTANAFRTKLKKIDSLDKRIKDRGTLHLDYRCIPISADEVAHCNDVAGLLMQRLLETAERPGKEERDALAAELKECRIVQVPVMAAKGNQTALTTTRFDNRTQGAIAAIIEAGFCDDDVLCDIDCAKLAKVTALIDKNAQPGQPSLIVDVHYSTLCDDDRCEKFLSNCKSAGQPVTCQVVFNIRDIPADTTNEKIAPIVEKLRELGCKTLIDVSACSLGQIDPSAMKISIVTGDYCAVGPGLGDGNQLKEFIADLHGRKTLYLMQNVSNAEAARQLFGLGTDLAALS